jgi:hypothetical protein
MKENGQGSVPLGLKKKGTVVEKDGVTKDIAP